MSERAHRLPNVGDILAGKYRLKRLLGEGGMGKVLEAEHLRLRQPIAIKLLNPALLGVAEIVERFEREARAAATLRSRHVVRVTDVEQTPEGVPYMVMELLDGGDLEEEITARGRLPYQEVVDYVLQVCGALVEAHEAGIVHRDLKPANLFLARGEPDGPIVKVLDFGISKFLEGDEAKLTSAGAVIGTALYMSPEQIRGDASIDARSDIWSLGVILYELIAGTPPWMGAPTYVAAAIVSQALPDVRSHVAVPDALADVIHAMLEKDPARRPRNIAEVAAALAPFALPESIGAAVAEHIARRHRGSSERNLASRARAGLGSDPSLAAGSDGSFVPDFASTQPLHAARAGAPFAERSTTAGTTTSAVGLSRGPRGLWGVAAAAAGLGIVSIVLIAFAGSKGAATREASVGVVSAAPESGVLEASPAPVAPPEPSELAGEPADGSDEPAAPLEPLATPPAHRAAASAAKPAIPKRAPASPPKIKPKASTNPAPPPRSPAQPPRSPAQPPRSPEQNPLYL